VPAAKVSEQPESNPLLLIILVVAGVWFFNREAAPTPDPKPPEPVVSDVLRDAYNADRKTQVAVLRELAQQPFDGATDEGRPSQRTQRANWLRNWSKSKEENPATASTVRGGVPNLNERIEKWQCIELVKNFEWRLEKTKTAGG